MLVIYLLAVLFSATLVNTPAFIRLAFCFGLTSVLDLLNTILESALNLAVNLYNIVL